MPKKIDRNLIVALDIGTAKVVAVVGYIGSDGVEIVGLGTHPSRGLKKGIVVNMDATVQAIQRAIEEAEAQAGCQIHSVYTGIAGSHIRSLNSHGIVAIRDLEVTQSDIDRVLESAKAILIPADQKILHVLPQEFIIDYEEGIHDPLGMSGVRLEAKVHVVTGSVSAAQNIVKCIRRAGLEVEEITLQQLASSEAVLTEDDKHLGVCLIDIGGGTTDIAVYKEGAICHTAVIPIAGDQLTNDLAVALRIPIQNAESIKINYGACISELVDANEMVEIPSVGEKNIRRIARSDIAHIMEPRVEELFTLIRQELQQRNFEECLSSGIVLTGGAGRMEGIVELAEQITHLPVRLGLPRGVVDTDGMVQSPIYATAVGLLLQGHQIHVNHRSDLIMHPGLKGMMSKMKGWLQGNF